METMINFTLERKSQRTDIFFGWRFSKCILEGDKITGFSSGHKFDDEPNSSSSVHQETLFLENLIAAQQTLSSVL